MRPRELCASTGPGPRVDARLAQPDLTRSSPPSTSPSRSPPPTARPLAVLDDISFELRDGEIVALLGKSGSGKSHAAALPRRPHRPTAGPGPLPPASRCTRREPRGRDGLPDLRACCRGSPCARTSNSASKPAAVAARRAPRPGRTRHRSHRPRRLRVRLPQRALRRHAPARRVRPRSRRRTRRRCSWTSRSPPSTSSPPRTSAPSCSRCGHATTSPPGPCSSSPTTSKKPSCSPTGSSCSRPTPAESRPS